MTRKVIFLDCDGVLLDMYTPFCAKYMTGVKPTDFTHYDLAEWPPFNGSREALVAAFSEFIESPEHGNLPPMVTITALEAMKAVGYELQVITQCQGSLEARANRVWNLVKNFGPVFSGVHFTVYGQSKLDFINRWAGDNLSGTDRIVALVEDMPDTVTETRTWAGNPNTCRHMRGIKAVGVKQTYNKASWGNPGELWFPGVDSFAFSLVHNTIANQDK